MAPREFQIIHQSSCLVGTHRELEWHPKYTRLPWSSNTKVATKSYITSTEHTNYENICEWRCLLILHSFFVWHLTESTPLTAQRITSNHIFSPSTFHWQCKKIICSLKYTLAPCGMSSHIFQLQSVHYLVRFLHIFKRKSPNYNSHSSRQTKAEWNKTYTSPQECNQTTIKICATTQKQSAIGQPLCLKFVYFNICTTVLSFFIRWVFAASLWTSPQKAHPKSHTFPPWRLQMVTLNQDHCRVAMVFLAGSNSTKHNNEQLQTSCNSLTYFPWQNTRS